MREGKIFRKNEINKIFLISWATFQEIFREKIFWSAVIFSTLLMCVAYAVSQVSFIDRAKIIIDFGTTGAALVCGLSAILLSAGLISKEIQFRTLYLCLSKPLARSQYIFGRYIGLQIVLFMILLAIGIVTFGVSFFISKKVNLSFITSLIFTMNECFILSSVGVIFSVFSTTIFSAIATSGLWVIGHAMLDLKQTVPRIEPPEIRPILNFFLRVLPDLSRFDIKAEVSSFYPFEMSFIGMGVLYAVFYSLFCLMIACFIFEKRNL